MVDCRHRGKKITQRKITDFSARARTSSRSRESLPSAKSEILPSTPYARSQSRTKKVAGLPACNGQEGTRPTAWDKLDRYRVLATPGYRFARYARCRSQLPNRLRLVTTDTQILPSPPKPTNTGDINLSLVDKIFAKYPYQK